MCGGQVQVRVRVRGAGACCVRGAGACCVRAHRVRREATVVDGKVGEVARVLQGCREKAVSSVRR